jgi:hypothetical protein
MTRIERQPIRPLGDIGLRPVLSALPRRYREVVARWWRRLYSALSMPAHPREGDDY